MELSIVILNSAIPPLGDLLDAKYGRVLPWGSKSSRILLLLETGVPSYLITATWNRTPFYLISMLSSLPYYLFSVYLFHLIFFNSIMNVLWKRGTYFSIKRKITAIWFLHCISFYITLKKQNIHLYLYVSMFSYNFYSH